MRSWKVQEAKAKFSEFLDASLHEGPQIVTRRGVAAAVLVRIEEWRRLAEGMRPSVKQVLLEDGPRWEAPPRRRYRRRAPPSLD